VREPSHCRARLWDPHATEGRFGALGGLWSARQSVRDHRLHELFANTHHGIQREERLLKDDSNASAADRAPRRFCLACELGATESNARSFGKLAGGREKAEQRQAEGALASTRTPNHTETLAAREVERDIGDERAVAAAGADGDSEVSN
jgi:hypothetical protein